MWIEIASLVTSFLLFVLFTMDFKTARLERKNFTKGFVFTIVIAVIIFILILGYDWLIAPVPMTLSEALNIPLYSLMGCLIGFLLCNYLILRKEPNA